MKIKKLSERKNLNNTFQIIFPIMLIIELVLIIYFQLPSNITYILEKPRPPVGIHQQIGNDHFFKFHIEAKFKNNSLKTSFIDTIEVFPSRTPECHYEIYNTTFNKKIVKPKQIETINFSITVKQNVFYKLGDILKTEPLVLRFIAKDGSNINDNNDKIAWIILGSELSQTPFIE